MRFLWTDTSVSAKYQILAEVLILLLAAVVTLFLFRQLRLSPVLGYLVVGLVAGPFGLGAVPTNDQALLVEFGIVFLLFSLGLFFITIGMRLDIGLLFGEAGLVAGLVVALIGGKAILVTAISRGFAGNWRDAARTSLAVAQGGEFGLALISLASSTAIISPALSQPVLAALILSMLISPLVIRANSVLTAWMETSEKAAIAELDQEMRATHSLAKRDHVVICGYGRVGQNVARLLEEEGFEYIALDLEPGRIRRARQAGDPVYYGDAAKAEILARIGLAHANAVVISFSDPLYAVRVVDTVRKLREGARLAILSYSKRTRVGAVATAQSAPPLIGLQKTRWCAGPFVSAIMAVSEIRRVLFGR